MSRRKMPDVVIPAEAAIRGPVGPRLGRRVLAAGAVAVALPRHVARAQASGGFFGWRPVPDNVVTAHGPALAAPPDGTGRLFLVATRADDGAVVVRARPAAPLTEPAAPAEGWLPWAEVPPGGGRTAHGPAAAALGGRLHVFVTGLTGNQIWETFGTTSEAQPWDVRAPGLDTDVSPAAVVFRNEIWLFAKRAGDGRIFFNRARSPGRWAGWNEVGGGGVTNAPLAAAKHSGRLWLFARGIADRGVYMNVYGGVDTFEVQERWSGWLQPTPGGLTDVGMAAASHGTNLLLFAKGIDDSRLYVNTHLGGARWSGFIHLPTETGYPGMTDAAPAAANHEGRVFLAAKGVQDRRLHITATTQVVTKPSSGGR